MGESGSLLGRFIFRILFFVFIFEPSRAVWLSLPPKGTKCVSEELHNNVVVLTDYIVIPDEPPSQTPTITIKVTSPFGKTIHHRENVTHGQFAFTASEAGNYLACFWADGSPEVGGLSVNVDWKTGIAAKDWDSVARKEKIEGLELEFSKLEAVVEEIHDNLLYLKTRELEMRSVSETTNSRVAWFSIMSLGVCIAASVVQILYLKQYFQKKKLI